VLGLNGHVAGSRHRLPAISEAPGELSKF